MIKMHLRHALPEHMEDIYRIIDDRIRWMDRVGIRQWNTTDYWGVYPRSYYLWRAERGELLVFIREDGKILAVGALLREDPRWDDGAEASAYYLHHFATDLSSPGIGSRMLCALEAYTKDRGKAYLRLDCAVDNVFLNGYYEKRGYRMCGSCVDGLYEGNLRQKLL